MSMWSLSVLIWHSVYCGFPDVLNVSRKPLFMALNFIRARNDSTVAVEGFDIETHHDLIVGEKYHLFLHRVYTAVQKSDLKRNG